MLCIQLTSAERYAPWCFSFKRELGGDLSTHANKAIPRTTAVTTWEHNTIIVAGGIIQPRFHNNIATVEVMDTKTLVWSTVASLPHPCSWGSAATCGDQLYMTWSTRQTNW